MASVQQVNANVTCNFEKGSNVCKSVSSVSEYVQDRVNRSLALFENSLCKVSQIVFSGDAEPVTPSANEVGIYVKYACESSKDGTGKLLGGARYR